MKTEEQTKSVQKKQDLIREGTYTTGEILPHVLFIPKGEGKLRKLDLAGHSVNMASDRLKLFATGGCTCVMCGLEGTLFAVEHHRNQNSCHLNLYGIDDEGDEVLITKDHIRAKAQGGENHSDNYQTMCTVCNFKKSVVERKEGPLKTMLHRQRDMWRHGIKELSPEVALQMGLAAKIEAAETLIEIMEGEQNGD